MPRHVIERVAVDHVVHPRDLSDLLARLVAMPAGATTTPSVLAQQLEGTVPGEPAEIVCPTCGGGWTAGQSTAFQHLRRHVSHAFSLESLVRVREQNEGMERALWAAVRTLEESAALAQRIGTRETGELKSRFIEKSKLQSEQAECIRHFLLHARCQGR
jgi:two-component system chemotaxis response regulator CheB